MKKTSMSDAAEPFATVVVQLPDLTDNSGIRLWEKWKENLGNDGMTYNSGVIERGFDMEHLPMLFPGIHGEMRWRARAVMVGQPLPFILISGDNRCISKIFDSTNILRWEIARAHGYNLLNTLDIGPENGGKSFHHLSYLFAPRTYEMARGMCKVIGKVPDLKELAFP